MAQLQELPFVLVYFGELIRVVLLQFTDVLLNYLQRHRIYMSNERIEEY